MSIDNWIRREFDKEAKIPKLEGALLSRTFRPYIMYRLRFFFLRVFSGALIHAVEFPFIYQAVKPGSISPILLFAAAMHLVGQWWWGALESLRSDVRTLVEEHKIHRVGRLIAPWLRSSILLGILIFVLGAIFSLLLGHSARFPVVSPEQAVMFIYLVRAASFIPVTTFHSGIYAVRRVNRPIAIVFLVDFLGIACVLALRPWLGSWAVPISLLCSTLMQNALAIVFVRRMYDFVGWEVRFPPHRGTLLPLKSFYESRTVLSGLASIVMSLDSLMIIAISLPHAGSRDQTLAMLLFLVAPLLRACHDWAMLFFPDIRRLNLELFHHLYNLLSRAMQRAAPVVALVSWSLAAAAAAAILGSRALELTLLLAPLFAVRSFLAFAQIRAFSSYHFVDMILGGICFIGGALLVPHLASSDEMRILLFACLYLPIIVITGLRYFRFIQEPRPEAIELPSKWFRLLDEKGATVSACAIVAAHDSNAGERRRFLQHLARMVHPAGAVTSLGERLVLVFGSAARLREKLFETVIHTAGSFDRVEWFDDSVRCRNYAQGFLSLQRDAGTNGSTVPEGTPAERAEETFLARFPNGKVIRLRDPNSAVPSMDQSLQSAVLRGAMSFAKTWRYSSENRTHFVSALVDGDVITVIFVIPGEYAEQKESLRAWEGYIGSLNLKRTGTPPSADPQAAISVSGVSSGRQLPKE